jgi:hypothetical protein
MRRQRAPRYRTGDDPCQIKDAKARKRFLACRKRPRRRFADLVDPHHGHRRDRRRLGMLGPLVRRPHRSDDAAALVSRRLKGDRIPFVERVLDRSPRRHTAEKLDDALAVVREIHVQPHEAAVSRAVGAEQRIAESRRRASVDRQIVLAAKLNRRMAQVRAHALARCAGAMAQLRRR